jgi:hypothetical protein
MTTDHDLTGLKALWSDSVLPEHLANRPATPEERLARAVLDDAIDVALDTRAYGRRQRVLRAHTEQWLSSDDVAWPYSFFNICDALAVDPVWVRERVRSLRAAAAKVRPAA